MVWAAYVFIVSNKPLVANVWRPWVVNAHIIHIVYYSITGYHHHVPTSAIPMPGECYRLTSAINLGLKSVPTKRSIGCCGKCEIVLVKLRPTAIYTPRWNRTITTVISSKAFIGFIALSDIRTKKFHAHLPAGCPAPHTCFLWPQDYWLAAYCFIRGTAAIGNKNHSCKGQISKS